MRTTNRTLEQVAAVVADDGHDPWEFATARERLVGLRVSGTTLSELHAGSSRPIPADDPEVWRLLRRSELRRSFGLQAKSCLRGDDRYSCCCGEVVFDEIDDDEAKALAALSRDERRRELLKRSKPHHIRPPKPRRDQRRRPATAVVQLEPEPTPEVHVEHEATPTPDPTPRPRVPRWYDEARPRFSEMKF
jgi:hypothetical protein